MNKNVIIGIVVVAAVAIVGYWLWTSGLPTQNGGLFAPEVTVSPEENEAIALTGVWRSTQDSNFIREFRADGILIDTYTGNEPAESTGTWSFVLGADRENLPVPADAEDTIVRVTFLEEVMYFGLAELSSSNLILTNYSGNGILEFERVRR